VADAPSLPGQDPNEERKGKAKDKQARAEEKADAAAGDVADLERKT